MCFDLNPMCLKIRTKRIFDHPEPADGIRILVDRLWPRGVSKSRAALDAWMGEIGPSNQLRQWFGHDVSRWTEFKQRYHHELDGNPILVNEMLSLAGAQTLTLLYSARDTHHNQAIALVEYLFERSIQQKMKKMAFECRNCPKGITV